MNKEQITAAILVLLGASGPLANILVNTFHMSDSAVQPILTMLTALTPLVVAGVFTYLQRDAGKVAAVASMSAPDQAAALNKVPDAAKVLVAKAVPGVATVVVKDTAGNGLAKLAADPAQPNIVTETQNETDAKNGTKP